MTIVFERKAERALGVPRSERLRLDRRRFLASSLRALGAYVVAAQGVTWIVGADKAWAMELDAFEPDLAETLLQMTRALYPHDFLGDVYYAKVVEDLDAEASGFEDKSRLALMRDGMAALNEAAGGTFTSADDAQKVEALRKIQDTPFFQAVRSKTVVSLYNQSEVWTEFGYEGPVYERGGYLFNGFNDLNWLPDPPADASPPVQI
ncbi:MAG: gluconate 2-dehydrogenase subunit 3 family protein [Geminicoccaceae bacterium]|nr:gluconate 2-dehydrogenase subunit 3 family protein [Geminicoccaceae bacterium]